MIISPASVMVLYSSSLDPCALLLAFHVMFGSIFALFCHFGQPDFYFRCLSSFYCFSDLFLCFYVGFLFHYFLFFLAARACFLKFFLACLAYLLHTDMVYVYSVCHESSCTCIRSVGLVSGCMRLSHSVYNRYLLLLIWCQVVGCYISPVLLGISDKAHMIYLSQTNVIN